MSGGGKRMNKRQLREQQELEALEQRDALQSTSTAEKERSTHQTANGDDVESDANRDVVEGEEEKALARDIAGTGLFSQLAEVDSASDGDEEEEEQQTDIVSTSVKSKSKNKKKKKKKKAATSKEDDELENNKAVERVEQSKSTKAPSPAKKKSKPADRGKATSQQKKDVSEMTMDEFSALLATQAQIDPESVESKNDAIIVTPSGPLLNLRTHLALSAPALDPAVELKRQFGAAAIKAYESEAGQGGAQHGGSAGARARAQARNPNFKVRNMLVQPKDTWPPIARTFTGMTMAVFDVPGRGKIGGWEHSQAYRRAQFQFLQAVQSYEPNHLMGLLRMYPWHIDTLLQLSDISRHQGDLGQASDFNARALFAFERTSAPIFTSSLASHLGPPMLNFDRIEDRGFWLAAHRNVNFLGRRGTWRTALEWVKLILGLDPANDHHGMLLWLDFLSIKSRQHAWFLECLRKLELAVTQDMDQEDIPILQAKTPFDGKDEQDDKGALDWYVGLSFAKALALRAVEKEAGAMERASESQTSTEALQIAIARHPHVIPPLLEKIGVALPANVPSNHPLFTASSAEGDTMPEMLSHIYVARSESLWRETNVSTWLTNTLKASWPTIQASFDDGTWCRPAATSDRARQSVYRHVLVSDLPDALRQTLVGLMPRAITQDSAMLNAFDPLPPQGEGTTAYNDAYFSSVRSRRGGGGADDDEYIDMDGPAAAGVMDRLMQALRGLRGLEGWAAAMENMDDESRQDVMAQMMQMAAEADQAGDGAEHVDDDTMPGALANANEGRDASADSDEVADGGRGAQGSFGALRGLLDRMWGGGAERADEREEEHTEEE